MLRLHPEWRRLVRRAWSVRFLAVAGALTAAEQLLPLVRWHLPPLLFGGLSLAAIAGAFVARVVAQKEFMSHDQE